MPDFDNVDNGRFSPRFTTDLSWEVQQESTDTNWVAEVARETVQGWINELEYDASQLQDSGSMDLWANPQPISTPFWPGMCNQPRNISLYSEV